VINTNPKSKLEKELSNESLNLDDCLFEYFIDEVSKGSSKRIKDSFSLYTTYKNMCDKKQIKYSEFKYNLAKEFYEKEVEK